MLMKSTILAIWSLLLSSANEETRQHHVEGLKSDSKIKIFSASTTVNYSGKVGRKLTCLDVLPRRWENINTVKKCNRACQRKTNCSGYHFNKEERICTVYLAKLQESSTQYCVKTAAILETVSKRSCAVGDTWSPTGARTFDKCRRRCTMKECYAFEYDSGDKTCTLFISGRINTLFISGRINKLQVSDGVRCDKKSSIVPFMKCPCFDSYDVDNAVSDITKGTSVTYAQETSCQITNEGSYGLHYMYNALRPEDRTFHSLSTRSTYLDRLGACKKDNNILPIAAEEGDACLTLLEDACATIAVHVDTCPCFDVNDLEIAIKGITDGTKKVLHGACVPTSGTSISIFYNDTSYHPYNVPTEGYNVYVSDYSGDGSCRSGGDIVTTDISLESASHCFSLIQNVCQLLNVP